MEFIGNIWHIFIEVLLGVARCEFPSPSLVVYLGNFFRYIAWGLRVVWGVAIGLWIFHLIRSQKCRLIAGPSKCAATGRSPLGGVEAGSVRKLRFVFSGSPVGCAGQRWRNQLPPKSGRDAPAVRDPPFARR